MKRILLFLTMALACLTVKSQDVTGIDLKPLKFEDVMKLVNDIEFNRKSAKLNALKCRFVEIINDTIEGEDFDEITIVYGAGVSRIGDTYEVSAQNDHARYLWYDQSNSTGAGLCFKNEKEAEDFWQEALNYGLLLDEYGGGFVPVVRLPFGSRNLESDDWGGTYEPQYHVNPPKKSDGWYYIHIGMDF